MQVVTVVIARAGRTYCSLRTGKPTTVAGGCHASEFDEAHTMHNSRHVTLQ